LVSRLFSTKDVAAIKALCAELDTVRLDDSRVLDRTLRELRSLMAVESMMALRVLERPEGWDIDLFQHDGPDHYSELELRMRAFLAAAPPRFAWYNAVEPEPDQRNRVVEAISRIPAGEYEQSRIYAEVFAPLRMERHKQLRVLVCEGASLLAWVGALHPVRVDWRQSAILNAVVPSLQRRLSVERRMRVGSRTSIALHAALDHIGTPAFVLDEAGRVHEANHAGSALLKEAPRAVLAALIDVVARRPSSLKFDLTPLHEQGTTIGWLAILRADPDQGRLPCLVGRAAARWGLTPRQRQVLDLVTRGMTNSSIAAALRVGERAVELHVSAIFDRAGVESRSALVACVLST
jgi:DNA-binding CsgD family transcriptional regulator